MLPQMGTSPQAIQALWQQAWAIMDAKGKERERALSAPQTTRTLRVCVHICTYVGYKACAVLCEMFSFVWFCGCLCAAYAMWVYNVSCTCIFIKLKNGCQIRAGGKVSSFGWREVGTISLLVTDNRMHSTSPQGWNQEAGPLTQAEREGGGSAKKRKIWPF